MIIRRTPLRLRLGHHHSFPNKPFSTSLARLISLLLLRLLSFELNFLSHDQNGNINLNNTYSLEFPTLFSYTNVNIR